MKHKRYKIVRTQFSVYEIIIDGKAFVGVTGKTAKHAVRGLLFSYSFKYKIPNGSLARSRLISFNELNKMGLDKFYATYVRELGSFDRPAEAQVAAIRRQNELAHEYEMVSKYPGQQLGTRQLFSDERLAELETELNDMVKKNPHKGLVYHFIQDHRPLHGYTIKKEG